MVFDEQAQMDMDKRRLESHVEDLAGKFDAVQIFVSRYDITTGDTVSVCMGRGNYHSRRGHVMEWMLQQDEQAIRELDEDE